MDIYDPNDIRNEAKKWILLVQHCLMLQCNYPSRVEQRPTSSAHVPWRCVWHGKASRGSEKQYTRFIFSENIVQYYFELYSPIHDTELSRTFSMNHSLMMAYQLFISETCSSSDQIMRYRTETDTTKSSISQHLLNFYGYFKLMWELKHQKSWEIFYLAEWCKVQRVSKLIIYLRIKIIP